MVLQGKVYQEMTMIIGLCISLMDLRSSSVKVTILKQQGLTRIMAEDIKQHGVLSTS